MLSIGLSWIPRIIFTLLTYKANILQYLHKLPKPVINMCKLFKTYLKQKNINSNVFGFVYYSD